MFIVLYGVNNLGKSTQAKKLVDRLQKEGHRATYIKYPIYDLPPSGMMINSYLRQGNPYNFSAREAQLLYILNRTQYAAMIDALLAQGVHVVAEDYTHTGIAWGAGRGVDRTFLEAANAHLRKPDIGFLFEGERFLASTEVGHANETNTPLTDAVKTILHDMGKTEGWETVQANDSIEGIHEKLWQHLQKLLLAKSV
jgi:dTMP kinase